MKRRHLIAFLAVVTLITAGSFSLWTAKVWASSRSFTADGQVLGASHEATASLLPYPTLAPGTKMPFIDAHYYALYNVESGKIIVDHDGEQEVPIASTTKLMTAHLATKYGTLTDVLTASDYAIEQGGSVMGLQRGEQISEEQVLYGLMLPSGNDAAHTLAEYIGRKLLNNPQADALDATARFVQEMNNEAARLNMNHTHYMDPAGLDDTGYSTADDLTKILAVDLQDKELVKITTTQTYTAHDITGTISHNIQESNRLVTTFAYPGASMGKTGFTPAAGHCLVASASRNGVTYVAAVLSTSSTAADASAIQARNLLDWGFNSVQYETVTLPAVQ